MDTSLSVFRINYGHMYEYVPEYLWTHVSVCSGILIWTYVSVCSEILMDTSLSVFRKSYRHVYKFVLEYLWIHASTGCPTKNDRHGE